MNTIAHASAFIAMLWLTFRYAFQVLGEDELGYALLGPTIVLFLLTFLAIDDDVRVIFGRAMFGFRKKK